MHSVVWWGYVTQSQPTIRLVDDVDAVLPAAHLALHEEVKAGRIARILLHTFGFRDIVPLVRLLAAVAALQLQEEGVVRMRRLQLVHVLQRGGNLKAHTNHFYNS